MSADVRPNLSRNSRCGRVRLTAALPVSMPAAALLATALLAAAPVAAAPVAAAATLEWRGVAAGTLQHSSRPGPQQARLDGVLSYALTAEAVHITDSGLSFGLTATLGSGDYERSLDRPGTAESLTAAELYLSLISGWGRLRLGDEDGAAKRAVDLLPLLSGGGVDGFWRESAGRSGGLAAVDHLGRDSDDATKLLYETPRLLGLRLGLSYAPERRSLSEDIVAPSPIPAEQEIWEVGLNWRGDLGAVSTELAAGWMAGQGGKAGASGSQSLKLAGLVTYGGFSLGGVGFSEQVGLQPGGTTGRNGLSAQLGYDNGPFSLALWGSGTATEGIRLDRQIGVSSSWRMQPGISLGIDIVRHLVRYEHREDDDRKTSMLITVEGRF
jgi:predicted porin